MSALFEFLGATIGVMSQAALATLFLEMNFIEGIVPDCLKTEVFDNRIEECYHLVLTQLLRLVQNKMPSTRTEFGKVRFKLETIYVRLEAYVCTCPEVIMHICRAAAPQFWETPRPSVRRPFKTLICREMTLWAPCTHVLKHMRSKCCRRTHSAQTCTLTASRRS